MTLFYRHQCSAQKKMFWVKLSVLDHLDPLPNVELVRIRDIIYNCEGLPKQDPSGSTCQSLSGSNGHHA
jgi:hypothetical protein